MSNNTMKNLFFHSLRSKQTLVTLASLLLFLAVVSFVLYEGTKKTVALTVNGEQQEFLTHANTVGELLEQKNIVVANEDYLQPSVNTSIENNLSIEWEQARQIEITVNGETQTISTTADLVSEVLAKANVQTIEHDAITPAADAEVGPDNKIAIEKAFELTLIDGKEEMKVWSTSNTVADFLKQHNIQLNEFDRVEREMDEVLLPNSVIQVVRVEKVTDVVEEETNFAVETKKDSSLLKGKEKIVQAGEKGSVSRTYEVVSENGEEVARNLISEKITKEPTKKVVAVGSKVVTASVSRGTSAPAGGTEFYVTATAYTAYCNGCSGTTKTGINLKANPDLKVIAVDPSVIPLGSKVWVEGYGYAVAGDTGGAIKGNKIDLFMPSKSQAYDFGRKKVRIKVLN
ncbi:ubiquitin-like domain-containing protein [Psychrobacillus sp.]|uniref:ubiquitin-like domain-containing protein n=1 Tax=Psychrobacillus sp. TaxID=1871623 RepID=UPI0028BD6657|nr:ubiquitin-like domain-containing protein [Psychrobacillus sp.]